MSFPGWLLCFVHVEGYMVVIGILIVWPADWVDPLHLCHIYGFCRSLNTCSDFPVFFPCPCPYLCCIARLPCVMAILRCIFQFLSSICGGPLSYLRVLLFDVFIHFCPHLLSNSLTAYSYYRLGLLIRWSATNPLWVSAIFWRSISLYRCFSMRVGLGLLMLFLVSRLSRTRLYVLSCCLCLYHSSDTINTGY